MKSKKSTEAQQSQLQLLRTASTFWRFRAQAQAVKGYTTVTFDTFKTRREYHRNKQAYTYDRDCTAA
ncbi:hypothetical protein WJD39_002971 [Escherichia coli]|nr:hypothetical protein [Escherichia coli]